MRDAEQDARAGDAWRAVHTTVPAHGELMEGRMVLRASLTPRMAPALARAWELRTLLSFQLPVCSYKGDRSALAK